MNNCVDKIKTLSKNCSLILDDKIISDELVIQTFEQYVAIVADQKEHSYGLVLHTGSIIFDAVAVAYAAISNMLYNSASTKEIINSLNKGDYVLYGATQKQRYRFQGFSSLDVYKNDRCIILEQSSGKTFVPESQWHRIIPYFGDSTITDGRGIRRDCGAREDFCKNVLQLEEYEYPSLINTSTVIVLSKDRVDRIVHGLKFLHGASVYNLLDLVPASYFTDNDEIPYGGNPGRVDPVLKFASRVSVGRHLLLDKNGNDNIGIIIGGKEIVSRSLTELPELINRKSVKYTFVMTHIDSEYGISLLNENKDVSLFACTKDFLLSNSTDMKINSDDTKELYNQIDAVIDRYLEPVVIQSSLPWQEYRNYKKTMYLVKKSDYMSDAKDEFIMKGYSLMNLFLTAPFALSALESAINDGVVINVSAPDERIRELCKLADSFPLSLRDKAWSVCDLLKKLYDKLHTSSLKQDRLFSILKDNSDKFVAVIVPKAYYAQVLDCLQISKLMESPEKLTIVSSNRFDDSKVFDLIITVGDFAGHRFNPFVCQSSRYIMSLLYDFESNIFKHKLKASEEIEKCYNNNSLFKYESESNYDDLYYDGGATEHDIEDLEHIESEMDEFVERLGLISGIKQFIINDSGSVSMTEAIAAGKFESGETVLFTKMYKAYVLNENTGDVKETPVSELIEGDSIIFTQNNEETRDIVDYLLSQLIEQRKVSNEVIDAYNKSKYWKNSLIEYMHVTGKSPGEIAKIMISNGVSVQELTIRKWLDEDSHTVGPRKKDSLEQIALLTEDSDMFDQAELYFNACAIIRKIRREILREIGKTIINKFRNNCSDTNPLTELISKRIESLAVILKLESIVFINKVVPMNATNRPLSTKE